MQLKFEGAVRGVVEERGSGRGIGKKGKISGGTRGLGHVTETGGAATREGMLLHTTCCTVMNRSLPRVVKATQGMMMTTAVQ